MLGDGTTSQVIEKRATFNVA